VYGEGGDRADDEGDTVAAQSARQQPCQQTVLNTQAESAQVFLIRSVPVPDPDPLHTLL
jgi:hypothetical protein